jgi:hypothetical protein
MTRLKHYTYKVTFPGMPWYYWGVHTDKGKPYFGSPVTHKWIWSFYECEVQILEWFENRADAERVEERLIRHFIDDPLCLNEHHGGHFSEEARVRGGRNGPKEVKIANGRVTGRDNKRLNRGIFDPHLADFIQSARVEGGKNGTKENKIKAGKLAAQAQHSQRWQCTETGFVSTITGISRYQRSRRIDPSKRIRLN